MIFKRTSQAVGEAKCNFHYFLMGLIRIKRDIQIIYCKHSRKVQRNALFHKSILPGTLKETKNSWYPAKPIEIQVYICHEQE